MKPTELFNRKNVTEIGLELPAEKPELLFDPKRDLTETDYEGMLEFLSDLEAKDLKGKSSWLDFLGMSSYLKILGRDSQVAAANWPLFEKELNLRFENHHPNLTRNASRQALMKVLSPDRALNLTSEEIIIMKLTFARELKENLTDDTAHLGWAIKVIDPSWRPELTDREWGRFWEIISFWRGTIPGQSINVSHLSELTAQMRLIAPERPAMMNHDDWTMLNDGLETMQRHGKWYSLAKTASSMTILAAHEAKITPRGIELTMQPPDMTDTPAVPLPETKIF